MKNNKKIYLLLTLILIIFPSMLITIPNVSAVTVGDTSFGINEGDVLTWVCTQSIGPSSPYKLGDKAELTIDSISNLNSSGPSGFLIVNVTQRLYNSTTGSWQDYPYPIPFIGFNATELRFYPGSITYSQIVSALLFQPTPLNLGLISSIINTNFAPFTATPIGPNSLNCSNGGGGTYYYEYNLNGIATTYQVMQMGNLMFTLTLETAGEEKIPFGMSFLLFSAITIIALAIIIKKRKAYSI